MPGFVFETASCRSQLFPLIGLHLREAFFDLGLKVRTAIAAVR